MSNSVKAQQCRAHIESILRKKLGTACRFEKCRWEALLEGLPSMNEDELFITMTAVCPAWMLLDRGKFTVYRADSVPVGAHVVYNDQIVRVGDRKCLPNGMTCISFQAQSGAVVLHGSQPVTTF